MTQGPGKPPHKYRQIADGLRARIETGELPVGAQLPSITELQAAYGAAKGTVDEALALLRELGLVETRHGAGSFVLRQRPEEPEGERLSEEVAALRAQVDELAKRVEAAEDADGALQAKLADLYGKTGHTYPEDPATPPMQQDRTVRHG